jgi:hypothetical protein
MTVAGMVAEKLFHRAKFVDRNTNLMCDEKVIDLENLLLPLAIYRPILICALSVGNKHTNRFQQTLVGYTHNDKSRAMK